MRIFKHAIVISSALAICASLAGADDKSQKETEKATKTKLSEKAAAKVPAALKGKLIEFKDGKIKEAEISGDVDFYVLYHSASW